MPDQFRGKDQSGWTSANHEDGQIGTGVMYHGRLEMIGVRYRPRARSAASPPRELGPDPILACVTMGRKPFKTPDEKLAIVLSVLRGETTQVDIARRLQMSQTTIAKWQKQFLEGGRESLARGDNAVTLASRREQELAAQVDDLTTAIGEAYVELRVWRKKGALYPRSKSSS